MNLTTSASPGLEAEKRKNVRLALGVATAGVLGFIVLYVIVFAVFFLSPWLIPQLVPFPALSEQVAGLEGRLLIFSREFNFRGASHDTRPRETATLRVYDGRAVTNPEEIAPFYSLYAAEKRVYLFLEGGYRLYDGTAWTEVKTPAVGKNPKGAADDDSVWVLSSVGNRPVLNLITGNETRQIPLPEDAGNMRVCSSRLVADGGMVHLFRQDGYSIFWNKLDGRTWGEPETFESEGGFDALAFRDKIFLFSKRNGGDSPGVALWIYDGMDWSKPILLPVGGFFLDIMPAVFKGRLVLFERGFFTEKLYYMDEKGTLAGGPYSIPKPRVFPRYAGRVAGIVVASNVLFFLMIYAISFVIGRVKTRSWEKGTEEYEFASLFRRFLAYFLDLLITALPAVAAFLLFFRGDMLSRGPFEFFGFVFCTALFMIIGSFLYHSLLEGLWGKTIGKKICGILVLSEDFERCSVIKGFVRNLLRLIDALFYYLVAAVSLSATMKWQRLGDIAAGTVVVREIRRRKRR